MAAIGDLPIKTVGNRTVYIRDVASVRDGFTPQTNLVHVDGKRGVLQPILKSGASTLDIVDGVKRRLPTLLATLPESLRLTLLSDQSIFVRAAIGGVVKEAVIAAGLTAAMILLFLGSWRSTLIVVISIPLSILTAIIALNFLGHTLNVMTLGGMALAVGILVDDATVEIEKHSPQPAPTQTARPRDSRRSAADRRAGIRLDVVHLHRLRSGRLHYRRGQIALHAAGNGGGLRHAYQLPAEPHAGADDGPLSVGRRSRAVRRPTRAGTPSSARSPRTDLAISRGIQPPVRAGSAAGMAARSPGRWLIGWWCWRRALHS